MKALLFFMIAISSTYPQILNVNEVKINHAFYLALNTIDNNTHNGILAAGADYGGEWTRDISINSWNCVSLLRPDAAEKSLWSVTINHDTIGHQYWDKIIWVIAALNHYKVNGDTAFLRQALICSENTIRQLENTVFDKDYGLFTGPSVFNDGIAGYPMPIYDSTIENSFVLEHPGSARIKCLSTNCIYYEAYKSMNEMAEILGGKREEYVRKAEELKLTILKYFYNKEEYRFSYLIDQDGKTYNYQEGLGISFAILFGIIDKNEAAEVIKKVHLSPFGLTSIYPDFSYFSKEKPGRHNNIVWPFINGFWALACKQSGHHDIFYNELKNLAALAIDADKGNNNFREIYNPYNGKPDGGWQLGSHWESCNHQTWSATAYIAMILKGIAGMSFEEDGIYFTPYLPKELNSIEINNLNYREAVLNIKINGNGENIKSFRINGDKTDSFYIPASAEGIQNINIEIE
jgi:glycogen debranching enzyme